MADGYWYHGNGKIGGEFHPAKPNDEEHYGEYVKVKHRHWIIDKDRRWHCSECDSVAPKGYRYPYCPYCGARMDEVEE